MTPTPLARAAALAAALALIANLFLAGARPEAAGLFPAPWDKLAHAGYFGVLAVVSWVADAGRRPWLVALALAGVGIADEWRQVYLPFREASMADLAADGAGIAAGLFAMARLARARRRRRATPA